jgi:hypothetical protein
MPLLLEVLAPVVLTRYWKPPGTDVGSLAVS